MLLRALESGETQGVGAQRAQKADVRVISATDADLEAKIADQTFRAPLLHRLASYEITLPPLRKRRDDLGRLLVHFLREDLARIGDEARFHQAMSWSRAWLPASLFARLADMEWPGNVRQFRNVVRQLVIGSRGLDHVEITPPVERLLENAGRRASTPRPPSSARLLGADPLTHDPPSVEPKAGPALTSEAGAPRRRPAEVTEEEIAAALREAKWELAAAAAALRISRASLYVLVENNPRFRMAGALKVEEIVRTHQACGGDLQLMAERLEVSARALQRRVRELGLH